MYLTSFNINGEEGKYRNKWKVGRYSVMTIDNFKKCKMPILGQSNEIPRMENVTKKMATLHSVLILAALTSLPLSLTLQTKTVISERNSRRSKFCVSGRRRRAHADHNSRHHHQQHREPLLPQHLQVSQTSRDLHSFIYSGLSSFTSIQKYSRTAKKRQNLSGTF